MTHVVLSVPVTCATATAAMRVTVAERVERVKTPWHKLEQRTNRETAPLGLFD